MFTGAQENFLQGKKNRFFRIEETTTIFFLMRKAEIKFLNRIFSTTHCLRCFKESNKKTEEKIFREQFSVKEEKLPEI